MGIQEFNLIQKIDARSLNFDAIDELLEFGFGPKALLEELVRSMDAYQVNDHLAYICRMHELEIPSISELEKYEKP